MKRGKKRAPLGHGKKIARNLAVTVVLLAGLWACLAFPLPRELQFRRLERANLLPRSEIIYQEGAQTVGLSGKMALSAWITGSSPDNWSFCRYPLSEDGPTLIPLRGEGSGMEAFGLVAVNVPEAVRVEVELCLEEEQGPVTLTGEGRPLSDGCWHLPFRSVEGEEDGLFWALRKMASGTREAPYTLILCNVEGEELARLEGKLPRKS